MVCRVIDHRWPGARTSAVARTRLIDDRAGSAIAEGVQQIVLLGGGFDSRAYRLEGGERLAFFDVDHPSTQARKRQVVRDVIGQPSSRVRFVSTGVTNYLTDRAVDHTLRWCARSVPPSQIAFTYVHRAVLNEPAAFYGTARLFATLEASGERWTFGLEPSRVAAYLGERGYRLDEDRGVAEYRARYFGSSSAAMRGYEFYRVVSAHVVGPHGDASPA